MPLFRRPAFAALVTAILALGTAAESPSFPPVGGEIAGDFTLLKVPNAPKLHARITGRSQAGGHRSATFEITGAGASGHGEIQSEADGRVGWHLSDAQLDLGTWIPALEPLLGTHISDFAVTGLLVVTGEGTWRDGKPVGRLHVTIRDCALHDPANTWSVSGIALAGTLDWPQGATESLAHFSFREASAAGITAHDGTIDLVLNSNHTLRVAKAECGFMDGHVSFAPFTIAWNSPQVATRMHFSGVELNRLARFLPSLLAEARGPVSGDVDVKWSAAHGFESANGALSPRPNEAAYVRLSPAPGFLTRKLPARLSDLLPAALRPFRFLFPAKIPVYSTASDIEMGRAPLRVQTVDVHMDPKGDAQGRTAHIVLSTQPSVANSAIQGVHFEINVTGPLEEFARLAKEGKLSIHFNK